MTLFFFFSEENKPPKQAPKPITPEVTKITPLPRLIKIQNTPIAKPPIRKQVILQDAITGKSILHWQPSTALSEDNLALIHPHTSVDNINPQMPKLELLLPNEKTGISEARLEVTYVRGNGARPKRKLITDRVQIPKDGGFRRINDDTWKIHQDSEFIDEIEENGFFGGDARLIYKLPNSSEETVIRFRISGVNPDQRICKQYIQSFPEADLGEKLEFMYAIARHESKAKNRDRLYYNQFLHLSSHPKKGGFPTWNNDGGNAPGGYGIFQVTGTDVDRNGDISRKTIWNWQHNIQAAFDIMTHRYKGSLARRYFNQIQNALPRRRGILQSCPPPNITVAGETFTAKQAIWITAYNGWGGLLKKRFVFSRNKPCGLGRNKRWYWNPPVKPNGKTYLQLIAEELEH